jgi:hypothetical protein
MSMGREWQYIDKTTSRTYLPVNIASEDSITDTNTVSGQYNTAIETSIQWEYTTISILSMQTTYGSRKWYGSNQHQLLSNDVDS